MDDSHRLEKRCKFAEVFAAAICTDYFDFLSGLVFCQFDEIFENCFYRCRRFIWSRIEEQVVTDLVEEGNHVLRTTD